MTTFFIIMLLPWGILGWGCLIIIIIKFIKEFNFQLHKPTEEEIKKKLFSDATHALEEVGNKVKKKENK